MLREEAKRNLRYALEWNDKADPESLKIAIEALEQQDAIEECTCCEYRVGGECCYADVEQTEDAISRDVARRIIDSGRSIEQMLEVLNNTPSVNPQPKTGHCKDCKYYDRVANVDGIPLIVAHEFCSRWGYGCKTKENGYCFLFEPQESED